MEDIVITILREYGSNALVIYLLYRIDRKLDMFISKFPYLVERILEKVEIIKYS